MILLIAVYLSIDKTLSHCLDTTEPLVYSHQLSMSYFLEYSLLLNAIDGTQNIQCISDEHGQYIAIYNIDSLVLGFCIPPVRTYQHIRPWRLVFYEWIWKEKCTFSLLHSLLLVLPTWWSALFSISQRKNNIDLPAHFSHGNVILSMRPFQNSFCVYNIVHILAFTDQQQYVCSKSGSTRVSL